jgi:hypothetical protein
MTRSRRTGYRRKPVGDEETRMNAPAVPGRGPRAEGVLVAALVAVVLVVAAGFVFDLPYGFGGWELALMAAPVVAAGLAVAALLRSAERRKRPRPGPGRDR